MDLLSVSLFAIYVSFVFNFIYWLKIFLGPDFCYLTLFRGSRTVHRAQYLPYRSATHPPYLPNYLALFLAAYFNAYLAAYLISCLGVSLAAYLATCLAAHAGTCLTAPLVTHLAVCLIGC